MSYRELRNMGNLLQRIGYTRLVSYESFRTPNFKLLEDIIRWIITRLDPDNEFAHETGTEQERITFIRAFVELMLKKVNLKLNPRRLYQADGYAVRELLKVTEFINRVIRNAVERKAGSTANDLIRFYQFQPSLTRVRKVQELASQLTKKGVSLFDALTQEVHQRSVRAAALNKHYDLKEFEQLIQKAIREGRAEQGKLESSIETAESNVIVINTKIEKKGQELERSDQRLQTMNKVRPAYMDEFDRIQSELETAYSSYVLRFKILCHLQHSMEEIGRIEEARRAEEKLIKQDLESSEDALIGLRRLSGSEEDDESILEDSVQQNARDFLISRAGSLGKLNRPRGTAKNEMSLGGRAEVLPDDELLIIDGIPGPSRQGPGRRVLGSMFGLEAEDEDDEETESESEILIDGQAQDENSDLGSEMEDDLLMNPRSIYNHKDPTDSLRIPNGQPFQSKPPPPGPTVSMAGSADDLKGHLQKQRELEERHLGKKSSKRGSGVPNGQARSSMESDSLSLTRPLEPEPRYTPAAVPSTSHQLNGGVPLGNGRGLQVPSRSSDSSKKYSSKGRPVTESKEGPLPERPRTRPGSMQKRNTGNNLISDDDEF